MPTINIEGQNVAYAIVGQGPAIVLLHGGTGDAASYWEAQVPFFAREFTVITIDQRGYGESALGDSRNYLESCADDLSELLGYLEVDRTHVVGLSLGGRVAQQFALRHAHLLDRLVLANTLSGLKTEKLRRFVEDVLIGTAEKAGMGHVFDLNLLWAFSEDYLRENRDSFELQKKKWSEQSAEDFISVLKASMYIDMTDDLHRISAPTLVIGASEDIEVPQIYSDILVDNIPNAVFSIIEGSGHKTSVEKPEEFNSLVRSFLL